MQWATGAVDFRVLLFATLCGTAVALLATVAPAIRMTRADVAQALRSAAPQLTASTGRLRQGLLVVQVALSVLLIVGAASFAQSLRQAYAFDMGVDLDRLVMTRLFIEGDSLSATSRRAMLEAAARRAGGLPGVERVTLAESVPLVGNTVTRASVPGSDIKTNAVVWKVTPDLLATVGFRLVRGRWILPADTKGAVPVALVTETMARKLWPGADAIGQCVRFGADTSPCREVVGVIRDLRQWSIREEAPPAALLSTAELDFGDGLAAYLVIRTSGRPADLVPHLRRAFRDIRPDLATVEIKPLADALDWDYRPLRLGAAMFGSFALLAVLLAAVGLYGILAFSVAQRTGEFGIRAALGARAGDLVRHVMGEGVAIVAIVAIGVLIGGSLSWYAGKTVETLLFNASARATAPYAVAVVVLVGVAVVASLIPAIRASRVDPATALRAE